MSQDDSSPHPAVVRRVRRAFSDALRAAEPWLAPVPRDPDVKAEVARERSRVNAARVRLVLLPLGALHWAIAAIFSRLVPSAAAEPLPHVVAWRHDVATGNAIIGTLVVGLAALAWTGDSRAVDGPRGWRRHLASALGLVYLIWGAVVTGIDQPVVGGVTAYMLAALGVASVARLRAPTSLAIYAVGWGILLVSLAAAPVSEAALVSAAVNGTVVTALAWLLSWLLDRNFERDVIARHVIDAQQRELRATNDELNRSLGLLRTANAELEHEVQIRAYTERQLERLATNDSLTDALSRRRFLELAAQECGREERLRGRLALAMLDIDHFKTINDRCGHAVGDEVLRLVVQHCRAVLRETDLIGRLGGDEFAVLAIDCPLDEATALAERVRAAVADARCRTRHGPVGCSVSIGVTELTNGDDTVEHALQRADDALYTAKSSGRNCVVARAAEPTSPEPDVEAASGAGPAPTR